MNKKNDLRGRTDSAEGAQEVVDFLKKNDPALPVRDLACEILARIPESEWAEKSAPARRSGAIIRFRFVLLKAACLLALLGGGVLFLRHRPPSENIVPAMQAQDEPSRTYSLEQGAEWLCRRQGPDGSWLTGQPGDHESSRLAVNGLALLALAQLPASDSRAPCIRRGAEYLASLQRPDGLIAGDTGEIRLYSHAIATLALLQTSLTSGEAAWREPLARALDHIMSRQDAYGGWSEQQEPGDPPNLFVSVWQLLCLQQALEQGWEECRPSYVRGVRWLARSSRGGHSFGYNTPGRSTAAPVSQTLRLSLALLDERNAPSPEQTQIFMEEFLKDTANSHYNIMFSVWALRQFRPRIKPGSNASMSDCCAHIMQAQNKGGTEAGSWNADVRWGTSGGRIGSTSLALISLAACD